MRPRSAAPAPTRARSASISRGCSSSCAARWTKRRLRRGSSVWRSRCWPGCSRARRCIGWWPASLEKFRVEFERVGGVFYRVTSLDEVPAVVGRLAREREARGLVAWHAAALGADLAPALEAQGLDVHEMPAGETAAAAERERLRAITTAADFGLTGVDLAVAETGTLILVSGPAPPRA